MADFSVKVDTSGFDRATRDYLRNLKKLPKSQRNPLVASIRWYQLVLLSKRLWKKRPTVGDSGGFAGARWDALDPAYVRKTDGVTVPVWGGVKRLRAGRVTRAGKGGKFVWGGVRQGTGTTKAERAKGYGVVKLGQTFTGRNVKGRLKSDGSRYKRSDKQLGKVKGGGMLHDFLSPPDISADGKSVVATSSKPYAEVQHDKRPWAWTEAIRRSVTARVTKAVEKWAIDEMVKAGFKRG